MEYRGPGFKNARLLRHIGKCPVSIVVIEDVRVGGKTARAAHDGNALPLAVMRRIRRGNLVRIQLDVVAYKKVEMAVPVIVEKSAARAPADCFLIEAGLRVTSVKVPSPLLWNRMLCPQKQQNRSSHPSLS